MRSVREAFVTSVAWTPPPCPFDSGPPVSCQRSQLSIVPKASSPRSARLWAPGTLSRSQRIFDAEK